MNVQESIKCYAKSVAAYNRTIEVINQNFSLAKTEHEALFA